MIPGRIEGAQVAEVFKKLKPGGVDPGGLASVIGIRDPRARAPGSRTLGHWSSRRSGLRVSGPGEEVRFPDAKRQRAGCVESGAKELEKHLPGRAAWL